jgi:pyridoxal phosphate enzyme (YggS family)
VNRTADQPDGRRDELRAGLQQVQARIRAACAGADRDPEALTLVVVTKTFPADDVRLLAGLGVADVGESRDQEAAEKVRACADLAVRWHFVGRLQSNKAGSVARYADLVHSVDRPSIVTALGRAARGAGRTVGCLLQVSLDGDPGRGGAVAGDVPRLAEELAQQDGLALRGVMAVAPLGTDPVAAFADLRQVAQRLRADHPDAVLVSAGMSADLEAAVAQGATHLRVGSAVLGRRPPLQYGRDAR